MNLAHAADGAGRHPFLEATRILRGLRTDRHLGDHAGFPRHRGHAPRLVQGAGHRFLAEDVFAGAHGGDRDHRVQVIGRAHHHCVAVLFPRQQLAEVGVGGAAA